MLEKSPWGHAIINRTCFSPTVHAGRQQTISWGKPAAWRRVNGREPARMRVRCQFPRPRVASGYFHGSFTSVRFRRLIHRRSIQTIAHRWLGGHIDR
eukprot:579732-Alexandrium_andersonii.AAC.1